uniref:Uncharacterized protein n=1 Tax=Arundo donax TaxID=35708 RepID=A0A0A8ZFY2_ARUDO
MFNKGYANGFVCAVQLKLTSIRCRVDVSYNKEQF